MASKSDMELGTPTSRADALIPSESPAEVFRMDTPQAGTLSSRIQPAAVGSLSPHWATNAMEWSPKKGCWVHLPCSGDGEAEDAGDDGSFESGVDSEATGENFGRFRHWVLIFAASIVTATVVFAAHCASVLLRQFVGSTLPNLLDFEAAKVIVGMATEVSLALLAYLVGVTFTMNSKKPVAHYVGGSCIPELKCELTGVHLVGLFHWRVLFAKMIGLVMCQGADLSVGVEGPNIHMAATTSHMMLTAIPYFRPMRRQKNLRHIALNAMVAVGVASSFQSPVGGVVFAMEILDSHGSVGHLHCFFGATVAGLFGRFLRSLLPVGSMFHVVEYFETNLGTVAAEDEPNGEWIALIGYISLGVICGLLGAIFVRIHKLWLTGFKKIVAARIRQPTSQDQPQMASAARGRAMKRRIALVIVSVALVNSLLTEWVPLLRQGQASTIRDLISFQTDGKESPAEWDLLISLLVKTCVTILVLGVPLPAGSIAPSFVIGSLVGRLFGQVVADTAQLSHGIGRQILIARFAYVGSCAFCAGSMRSFGQVVMAFERTGLKSLLLPLCASSVVAVLTAKRVFSGVNFFDSVIQAKRLPHLPALAAKQGRRGLTAEDVKTTDLPVVTPQMSCTELQQVLLQHADWQYEVPVVVRQDWEFYASGHSFRRISEDAPMLLSSIKALPKQHLLQERFGAAHENWIDEHDVTVPLQVPPNCALKDLLPLLNHMHKSVAFVTRRGRLEGAVTLTEMYRVLRKPPHQRIPNAETRRMLVSWPQPYIFQDDDLEEAAMFD